jgi:Mn-containing catalase
MPEVKELEKRNLHNQQWTFSDDQSGLGEIFHGTSPFNDGDVEALDGFPDGFEIPQAPGAPQEYSPGLDKALKQTVESIVKSR